MNLPAIYSWKSIILLFHAVTLQAVPIVRDDFFHACRTSRKQLSFLHHPRKRGQLTCKWHSLLRVMLLEQVLSLTGTQMINPKDLVQVLFMNCKEGFKFISSASLAFSLPGLGMLPTFSAASLDICRTYLRIICGSH